MKAVIMAGGEGARLGGVLKPLLRVCGRPIIESVINAVRQAGLEPVVAYTVRAVAVAKLVEDMGVRTIATPGPDYASDVLYLWRSIGSFITVPGDTPFITPTLLREFIERASSMREGVVTLIREEGCGGRVGGPVGVSLVRDLFSGYASVEVCEWPDLLDIDTYGDLKEAELLCRGYTGVPGKPT